MRGLYLCLFVLPGVFALFDALLDLGYLVEHIFDDGSDPAISLDEKFLGRVSNVFVAMLKQRRKLGKQRFWIDYFVAKIFEARGQS